MMNDDVAEGKISLMNETLCDVIPGNVTLGMMPARICNPVTC